MKRFSLFAAVALMGVALTACSSQPAVAPVAVQPTKAPTEAVPTVTTLPALETTVTTETPTTATTAATTAPTAPVASASTITVHESADTADGIYTHFVSSSDYAIRLILEADGYSPSVNVMRLGFDSEANYQIDEVFSLGAIDVDAPLAVTVDFPGDMSAWGLSFTDANGNERVFTLFQSGLDGSIRMSEGIV